MAGCLTDMTSHSVPDYALYEQNPRQGRVSPDPRRGWGGGQAARGQRRGSAAWRRTRGRASLQGVSFGARVSELRGAPNRSAASQRGPLTPPPGPPRHPSCGDPSPGARRHPANRAPAGATATASGFPAPSRVFLSLPKRDLLQEFLGARIRRRIRPNPRGRHPGRALWSPPAPGGLRTATRGQRGPDRNRSPSRIRARQASGRFPDARRDGLREATASEGARTGDEHPGTTGGERSCPPRGGSSPNRPPYGSRRPLSACQNSTAPSQSKFQRSSAFMGRPSSSEWTSFPPALLGGGARW